MTFIMAHESLVRLGVFSVVLLLMIGLEYFIPRRINSASKSIRWMSNLGLATLGTLLVVGVSRVLLLFLPMSIALYVEQQGWGLMPLLDLPVGMIMVLGILALDLLIYGQHVMFHHVPLLWRLHLVHHTDRDLDATSGIRFHPVEIVLSIFLKIVVVVALGIPAVALVIFEIILNAMALFNHSNIKIPKALDKVMRLIVVTPDMHRVHHSIIPMETNSNFGFNLPWWDWIFKTYRAQPQQGHIDMTLGLKDFKNPQKLTLYCLVRLPFFEGD